MSIQFPDPPTQGDSFTASNGVIYTYNNGGWMANSVSGLDDTYVNRTGDTMTGDLTVPNLISEGDVQTTSLNGGPLGGFRNQIINGNFHIHQRGTTGAAVAGYQTADRWRINGNRASIINNGPNGITDSLQSLNAGDTLSIRQPIELPLRTGDNASNGPFLEGTSWTLISDYGLTRDEMRVALEA